MTKFKLAEFFCGPGGMGYGASLSKVKKNNKIFSIDHAWASDYEKIRVKLLIKIKTKSYMRRCQKLFQTS